MLHGRVCQTYVLNRYSRISVAQPHEYLVNLVYDMDTYIFKVNVFTEEAKYE